MKRAIIIVLDSAGIGALPDAGRYGDAGANTLGHIAGAVSDLSLPHFQELGLGNIAPLPRIPPSPHPAAAFGKAAEQAQGKDTTVGHWEIAGLVKQKPFPVYPEGFPPDLVARFEKIIGTPVIGNCAASGTEILDRLGPEHLRTGRPILYTSADSVFQIAGHEEVFPLEKLYGMCRQARTLLAGEHAVARVIARPFIGKPGNFVRTSHRHDFSFPPPEDTLLDVLVGAGRKTFGVGKIYDIFAGKGISEWVVTESNRDGVDKTLAALGRDGFSLIFTNLVDFDSHYGHRRNTQAYARALEEFDALIPKIRAALRPEDILFFTADHGCDPTFAAHTDHTREYIPILVLGRPVRAGADLGTRKSFADIGQTIAEYLGVESLKYGTSFLGEIKA
ncbi:MAG: phosphopentomutase [Candidatus Aureabacteria bacterium]|nr:phosphopentomutase [Candidatus Auribacterota bacterium]